MPIHKTLYWILILSLVSRALSTQAQWSYSEGLDGAPVKDVVTLDTTLFICGHGISFRSINGGSWEKRMTNAWFHKIYKAGEVLFAENTYCVYTFRSFDHGDTWQWLDSSYSYPYIYSIATLDTLMFFTSDGDIFRSDDYGDTYYSIKNNISLLYVPRVYISDSTLLCCGYYYSDQPLYYSTNLGLQWDTLPHIGLPQGFIETHSFIKYQGQFWLSTFKGIFRFDTLQGAWVQTTDVGYYAHLGSMKGSLFAGTMDVGLIRWDPTQSIWIPENSGLETEGAESFWEEDSLCYVATYVGPYYCTQPYDWQPFYDGLNQMNLNKIAFLGDEIWVFNSRGLFCSTNNGVSFIKHTWAGYSEPEVLQMTDSLFYMIVEDKFYISSDHGETWSRRINGLPYTHQWPRLNLQSLAMNDEFLFLGTNKGLFRSEHHPISWRLLESLNTGSLMGVNIFNCLSLSVKLKVVPLNNDKCREISERFSGISGFLYFGE